MTAHKIGKIAHKIKLTALVAIVLALTAPTFAQNASDVTSSVQVKMSGLRLNRATGRFVGVATVTNVSGTPISGPISLVVALKGGVTLYNAAAKTNDANPRGPGSVSVPLTANVLLPGAFVRLGLEFDNPGREPIVVKASVLAGPGAK
jgi:hypothetical protein